AFRNERKDRRETMSPHRRSRREFMGVTGAGLVAAGGSWRDRSQTTATTVAEAREADLVVFNAKVYTVDARVPTADAFAIKGARFIAIGSTADVKGLIGKDTETFDAKQMTVVPGFADCHNHAPGNTLLYEVIVGNPFEVEFVTIRSIVEKLRAK